MIQDALRLLSPLNCTSSNKNTSTVLIKSATIGGSRKNFKKQQQHINRQPAHESLISTSFTSFPMRRSDPRHIFATSDTWLRLLEWLKKSYFLQSWKSWDSGKIPEFKKRKNSIALTIETAFHALNNSNHYHSEDFNSAGIRNSKNYFSKNNSVLSHYFN